MTVKKPVLNLEKEFFEEDGLIVQNGTTFELKDGEYIPLNVSEWLTKADAIVMNEVKELPKIISNRRMRI